MKGTVLERDALVYLARPDANVLTPQRRVGEVFWDRGPLVDFQSPKHRGMRRPKTISPLRLILDPWRFSVNRAFVGGWSW